MLMQFKSQHNPANSQQQVNTRLRAPYVEAALGEVIRQEQMLWADGVGMGGDGHTTQEL